MEKHVHNKCIESNDYIYQMLLSKVTYSAFRLYIYIVSMCVQ